MNLISTYNFSLSELLLQKIKTLLLLAVFTVGSFNVFAQTSSLISDCGDFVSGPSAWPYVLVATTLADGSASQGAQTYTMNVTALPAGGANFRVYKTVANGNDYYGNPVALVLGSNSITVSAVSFDRAVKFQFSDGSVEFDALELNGVASSCVVALPPPTSSLISDCDDFVSGPSAWPYVLVATTLADGVASQGAQTFTMNVTALPAGGANFRVYKTTANGSNFFGNPVALVLGSNSITVAAVSFDRAVKFQFSDGSVEFDALSLNGENSDCICTTTYSTDTVDACDSYIWIDGNTYTSSNNIATHTLINATGCDSIVALDLTIISSITVVDTVNACDSYIWIDGNTYTSSNNIATYTLINSAGCDSIVVLDLTINNLDIVVFAVDDSTLQAQSVATGILYQWVDCSDNFNPIAGENSATFTTQNSGYYAVETTLNNCSVISDCFTITSTTDIDALDSQYGIHLFPNPTTNNFSISFRGVDFVEIVILDIKGKVLLQKSGIFEQDRIDLSNYVAGTYFVKIVTVEGIREIRVTKQ